MHVDRSAFYLIVANLFTLVVALVEQWELSFVMWIYWGQSVVIGYFNWKRMRSLKQFSTEGFTMNDSPVPPTKEGQRRISTFFAVHYGFFHAGYLAFLISDKNDLSVLNIFGMLVCIIVFFFNHRLSFRHNLKNDLKKKPNIGTMMFFPYARILPMHLTIILGDQFSDAAKNGLLFFLMLKTVSDWIMHVIEHRAGRKNVDGEGRCS